MSVQAPMSLATVASGDKATTRSQDLSHEMKCVRSKPPRLGLQRPLASGIRLWRRAFFSATSLQRGFWGGQQGLEKRALAFCAMAASPYLSRVMMP